MPRAIWSGSISFGLVNIPVKLYSAVSRKTVHFNQIDARTRPASSRSGCRRRRRGGARTTRSSRATSCRRRPVRDHHRRRAGRARSRRPSARSTSRSSSTWPRSTRSSTTPPTTSRPTRRPSPTRCWPQAMERAGKVGIARFVMRTKQYLAAIAAQGRQARAVDDGLRRRDQRPATRSPSSSRASTTSRCPTRSWPWPRSSSSRCRADFEPEKFHDTYREQVLEPDRAQGRRRGDRGAGAGGGRGPTRSSTYGRARGVGGGGQGGPQAPSHGPRRRRRGRRRGRRGDGRRERGRGRRPPAKKARPGPLAQVGLTRRGPRRDAPRRRTRPVEIDGRQLMLTNLDKVLYPETGSPRARSSTTTPASRRRC